MTKILILSDTHWNSSITEENIPAEINGRAKYADEIIHAGNYGGTAYNILKNKWIYKAKLKKAVLGNGDHVAGLRGYETDTIGGIKIGIVHNPFKYFEDSEGKSDAWVNQELISQDVKNRILSDFVEYNRSSEDPFSKGITYLMNIARDLGVDILVFGHFHHPLLANGERLLICPGCSPGCSDTRNSPPTMASIDINPNGDINAAILFEKIMDEERTDEERTHVRRLAANHSKA